MANNNIEPNRTNIFADFNEQGQLIRNDYSSLRNAYVVYTYDTLGRMEYEIEIDKDSKIGDTTFFRYSNDTVFITNNAESPSFRVNDRLGRTISWFQPDIFADPVQYTYFGDTMIMTVRNSDTGESDTSYYDSNNNLVKRIKFVEAGWDSHRNPTYAWLTEEWVCKTTYNSFGDWTEIKRYLDGALVTVRKRTIRYW